MCPLEFSLGVGAVVGAVAGGEGLGHDVDDVLSRLAGLAAQRVDALLRAGHAFVGDLRFADAQDLDHLVRIDVVAHRRVVEQGSVAQTLLRGTADLAAGRGDIVDRFVEGFDAEGLQRREHPLVEEDVGLLVVEAGDEGGRDEHRVGDAVASLHEHGTAAGDPAHDLDIVLGDAFGAQFVDIGLEGADDGGCVLPFPESQGRCSASGGDLLEQHLVECHVHLGRQHLAADDLPVEVGEVRGRTEGAADDGGDVSSREAVHGQFRTVAGQGLVETSAQSRIVGGDAGSDESRGEVEVGLFGFEEEVAGDLDLGDGLAVGDHIGDDEFAADDLVFAVEVLRIVRHVLQPTPLSASSTGSGSSALG